MAGKYLPLEGERTVSFEIAIPAAYYLVTKNGPANGTLNGKNYEGPVQLQVGRHEYGGGKGESIVALVWAQAMERGFEPAWTETEMKN